MTGINSIKADANDNAIPDSRTKPRGIPGRVFVIPFVLVTVALGVLMFSVAMRFQTIMTRLEESRSLWPEASKELEPRYSRINEKLINSKLSQPFIEEWESGRKAFLVSGLFDRQSNASIVLEHQIAKSLSVSERNLSDFELPSISKLIEAERRRRVSQDDMIGWLTVQSLRLKLPSIYAPIVGTP